ncbi:hypothetical protein ABH992_007327 [Bradyrhizobium yuanmingense]|uniref:Uncharacterized protein n=1 Tax=Bradyrhizobium yuanmingense TaxID=108015 RepID=A0ABV4GSL2_9BRAD
MIRKVQKEKDDQQGEQAEADHELDDVLARQQLTEAFHGHSFPCGMNATSALAGSAVIASNASGVKTTGCRIPHRLSQPGLANAG